METRPSHQEIETKNQRLYLKVLDRVVSDGVWQSDQAPKHTGNLATILNTTHSRDGLAKAKDYALDILKENLYKIILLLRDLSRTTRIQGLSVTANAPERNLILTAFEENVEYIIYFLVNKSHLKRQEIESELRERIKFLKKITPPSSKDDL